MTKRLLGLAAPSVRGGRAFIVFFLTIITASLAGAAPAGGRLVVSLTAEPKHFNPVTAVDQPTRTLLRLLMSDLSRIDRASLEVAANLAEDVSVSPDGRSYTLTLCDGIRFSDGHPLDADDVVFSFGVYLDEKVHSPQRDLLIVGGKPVRVTKLDTRRVRFDLASPYAAGERLFDSFYVLPQHVLEPAYSAGEIASAWGLLTEPEKIVGLGPFRLKRVVAGERIVVERNPYFWKVDDEGTALPYLDEIVFVLTPSKEAEVLRFRAGEIDVIENVDRRSFELLVRDGDRFQMRDLGPGLEHNFLFFNLNDADRRRRLERTWFRNTGFRRAVAAAIDKKAIVELVYGGRGSVLETHVSPGNKLWVDPSLAATPASEARARRLFEAAGFGWDEEGRLVDTAGNVVGFSLLTNADNPERTQMASLIQEDLRRVGVNVRITALEFRAYVDRIFQTRDYDAALLALGGGDVDPNPQMSFLLTGGGLHVWCLEEEASIPPWQAEIDRLMREQLTALGHEHRKRLYDRVQEIVAEYRPFISLVSPHILVGADRRLRNFRPGILPPYTLWNAEELRWAP